MTKFGHRREKGKIVAKVIVNHYNIVSITVFLILGFLYLSLSAAPIKLTAEYGTHQDEIDKQSSRQYELEKEYALQIKEFIELEESKEYISSADVFIRRMSDDSSISALSSDIDL